MKQLIAIGLTSLKIGGMFSSHSFSLLLESDKLFPFQKNRVRKNMFVSVCHCLDPKICQREMDIVYLHSGIIGYGGSNLVTVFRHSTVFCLNAKYHDAFGAVHAERGNWLAECYVFGRESTSRFLSHTTAILYCVNLRTFDLFFQSVSLLMSMISTLGK